MLKTVSLHEMLQGRPVVSTPAGTTVAQAAKLMSAANKGAILVTENGKLAGIFTERDLLRRVAAEGRDPGEVKVDEVMTAQLVVGEPGESYLTALRRMVSASCRHLPVVDGDRVIGMVSRRDLMAVDIRQLEEEIARHDPSTLFI